MRRTSAREYGTEPDLRQATCFWVIYHEDERIAVTGASWEGAGGRCAHMMRRRLAAR